MYRILIDVRVVDLFGVAEEGNESARDTQVRVPIDVKEYAEFEFIFLVDILVFKLIPHQLTCERILTLTSYQRGKTYVAFDP
jgi:hypothetical protein